MKIPAIRANIGDWTYYITTLTFEQVAENVEKIDKQLHNSEGLRDLIQRSITDNYVRIKDYIANQPEMFFNSLVLGVYDAMPKWIEVELNYEDEEYFNLGFLDFPTNQKIFPIDGQHRVEGIKEALKDDSDLKDQKIGAIFIGHSKSDEGMQRSRRLFTTLNRYAKPVTMDDIIALDEDDSVAISTRHLLEEFDLFKGKRVTKSKNKAIPDGDKNSITSIITLYQCNKELLKKFRALRKEEEPEKNRDKMSLADYLKFRPNEKEVNLFIEYVKDFWKTFKQELDFVSEYSNSEEEQPALAFRNKITGGNLVFRPVGILPFIQAINEIKKRNGLSYEAILSKFNSLGFDMSETPWKSILWNPEEKTMIMGTQTITKLLFIYMYEKSLLTKPEANNLKVKLADKLSKSLVDVEQYLKELPKL